MLLKDLFEKFVREKTYIKNVSPATVKFYNSSWKIAAKYIKATTPAELSKDVLTDLVVDLRTKAKQSPKSINTYITCLNAFFTWLKDEGHTEAHFKLPKLKLEQTVFRVFNEGHIKMILRYQPKEYYDHRLWATLCLLLDTGLRISETLSLKNEDVRIDQQMLIVKGKGRKERYVPISSEMRRILFRFIKHRERLQINGGNLFPTMSGHPVSVRNFQRDMKIFCRKLGITGVRVSPHTLRHSYAIWYLVNGGDLYTLSRTLGHSSIAVTEIYLRSMGIEQVAMAHQQFSPLAKR